MKRIAPVLCLAAAAWAAPVPAYAAETAGATPVHDIAGAAALAAAVVLLVAALGLERVARGSAIADNISYVVGACICIGASALTRWVARLIPGFAGEQAALSSDVLMLVAIILFSVYFFRVRTALRRFLDITAASEPDLVRAQVGGVPPVFSEGINDDSQREDTDG